MMVDPEFLAALQRSPESILAEYELNDDERSVVLRALARLAQMPAAQREGSPGPHQRPHTSPQKSRGNDDFGAGIF